MPRFFTNQISGNYAVIDGEEAVHIARVLRCRVGEQLTLCDGCGNDYLCRIAAASDRLVELEVLEQRRSTAEPPVKITLYQAVPKGDKLELIVQKAVELGAARIVPVITRFCVSRPEPSAMQKRVERLQRVSLEAAKQSGRGIIPEVGELLTLENALERMSADECAILFYEHANSPLGKLLEKRPASISFLVGSEGGFDTAEVEAAQAAGLAVCTMGPRILRCETAPLYALSAITYQYENH